MRETPSVERATRRDLDRPCEYDLAQLARADPARCLPYGARVDLRGGRHRELRVDERVGWDQPGDQDRLDRRPDPSSEEGIGAAHLGIADDERPAPLERDHSSGDRALRALSQCRRYGTGL